MIQALLRGDKTMTRRLAWRERKTTQPNQYKMSPTPWQRVRPADRIWVRESLKAAPLPNILTGEPTNAICAYYAADNEDCVNPHGFNLAWLWERPHLPSIHMPRPFSRLTLIVTATKIERLQDISEEDAKSEGIEYRDNCYGTWNSDGTMRCGGANNAREAFRCLWININGNGTWETNPEVVAVSSRVIKANIDAPEAKAA
jgi:hypothetical protein